MPSGKRDIIDDVKRRTDIIAVIGRYVSLSRKGKHYWGLCPFHKESAPSFKVSPELGLYYCFGCKASGTVFNFLMEMEAKSFGEALEELAREAGVALPKSFAPSERTKGEGKEASSQEYYNINFAAAEFFVKQIKSQEGRKAMEYLHSRGFTNEILERFDVGFGGMEWDGLYERLKRKGYNPALATELGLLGVGASGKYYDRFRERVIFPIKDVRGRVVGFGGRIMDDVKETAKYLNSSDSHIYNKSQVLYALPEARQELKELGYVVLVEGYMDCLKMYQAGFSGVVAVCGTALTERHCEVLSRYTNKVKLLFDGDSAGRKAALSAAKLLIANGLEVEAVRLPDGEDPDSFIEREGVTAMEERLKGAVSAVEFAFEESARARTSDKGADAVKSVEDKVAIIESIGEIIAAFPKRITRELYISQIAEKLSLDEKTVSRHLRARRGGGGAVAVGPTEGNEGRGEPSQIEKHSLRLIALALLQPGVAFSVIDDETVALLSPEELREGYITWSESVKEGRSGSASDFTALLPEWMAEEIFRQIFEFEESGKENYEALWAEILYSIKLAWLEERKKALLKELKGNLSDTGINEQLTTLLEKIKTLKKDVAAYVKKAHRERVERE